MIPGAEEVLALLELRLHALSRRVGRRSWSTARPTAETLRLLALPEALGWYMQRVFPVQQRVVKALRPVLTRAAGRADARRDASSTPSSGCTRELDEVRALLTGPDASVRIVLTPEAVVLAEARRVVHDPVAVRLPRRRRGRQPGLPGRGRRRLAGRLGRWPRTRCWPRSRSRSPGARSGARSTALPSRSASRRSSDLARALYDGADPVASSGVRRPVRVISVRSGVQLRLRLPFVTRDQVDLARSGDELVVTVGSYRRLLTLPAGLAATEGRRRPGRRRGRAAGPFQDPTAGAKTATRSARMSPVRMLGSPARRDLDAPPRTTVGSVGDEAAKLLGALADWARRATAPCGRTPRWSRPLVAEVNDHIATGDAECTYCPICRTVHAVREASPEVQAHLATGGRPRSCRPRPGCSRRPAPPSRTPSPGAAHRPRRGRARRRPTRARTNR